MTRSKPDHQTGRLFRSVSGQNELFEKSREEELKARRGQPVECLGMTFENDEVRRAHFLGKLREGLEELHEKLGGIPFVSVDDAVVRMMAVETWPMGEEARLRDLAERMRHAESSKNLLQRWKDEVGFPHGEIEDILNLSDPPYYTACPNSFIGDFIKHYGKRYDPETDDYRREPYAADVSEGKNDPIYNAHSYHTKVPHKAIMRYILHYTQPGDVVFDGFCGTGMTGVAAQACANPEEGFKYEIESELPSVEWGAREAVLVDLSPAATFIARNYNAQPSIKEYKNVSEAVLNDVRVSLGWLYKTKVDGHEAEIYHTVWSDVFTCPECAGEIVFWDCAVDPNTGSISDDLRCPECSAVSPKRSLSRKQETVFNPDTGKTQTRAKLIPVSIKCTYGRPRFEKTPDDEDLGIVERSERETIPHWYPMDRIDRDIDLWYERDYTPLGIYSIDGFFTRRNLRVLAALWDAASVIDDYANRLALQFTLTGMQVNLSRMNRWRHNVSFPYNPLSGTLYVGSLPVESNVFVGVENKIKRLCRIWSEWQLGAGYLVSTESTTDIKGVPDDSIDYIFTDPPFGSNIIYSDLSIIWESWHRIKTNTSEEAVVHRRKKENPSTLNTYINLMAGCFSEMQRMLKPGRWITVEFHNSKNAVWNAIQESILRAGFVVADVRVLDKKLGTFKQVTASGAVKQDLVISAYKPNGGLEERFRLTAGTEDGVWDFVRTHLGQLPVFVSKDGQAEAIAERQNYLLFDRMVAFHVQRGVTVPMSAAEFYAGLVQRFPERDGMYFLPDQVAEYDKKRMTVKEVLQLEIFVIDEASAIQWLRQQLSRKPQTFPEIQPQFMPETRGWQKHEKLPELSEMLEQNFLRYDGTGEVPSQIHGYLSTNFKELRNLPKDHPGLRAKAKDRWYDPDPNKAGDLEKLRERGLLREFEQYRESTQKRLKVFRLEAVRAGFKKAWQERDYETIIAVARKVPENVLQEDPKLLMWSDQALTRSAD